MIKKIFKRIAVFILRAEAKLILRRYQPKIAAVGGTVGKTSAKDAIALVFNDKFNIRKSEKSYNSKIGVPLTIIGASTAWNDIARWFFIFLKGIKVFLKKNNYPEWLVLELGVDRPKDMERLLSWIHPRVAVMTAVGEVPVHVEFFQDTEELAKEKIKLVQKINSGDYAILNGDDKTLAEIKKTLSAKVITYGFAPENDIVGSNYHLSYDGIAFKTDYKGNIVPVRMPNVFGKHCAYAAMAALGAGISQGLNLVEMSEALSKFKSPPGRLNLLKGIKNSFILDDTYNSSPMAAAAAMEVLRELPAKRKIAVLGDMLELGKFTIEEHKKLGRMAKENGIDFLFAVGLRAKFIAEEARAVGFVPENIFEFSSSEEVKTAIQEKIQEGDLILVKGSQAMRMERIVEEIMTEPEKKENLLVRQEPEWLNKK